MRQVYVSLALFFFVFFNNAADMLSFKTTSFYAIFSTEVEKNVVQKTTLISLPS